MGRHVVRMSVITILVIVSIFYPFLPGTYDAAASGLSTMAQLLSAAGPVLVPVGILWAVYEVRKQARIQKNIPNPGRSYRFALGSLIFASVILIPVLLVILFGIGKAFGILAFAFFLYALFRLRPVLKSLKETEAEQFISVPLYLIFIPLAVLIAQVILASPATEYSRNYAIAHSAELINDIEQYHAANGRYPYSLLAVWKDYNPAVVGVEKFHYVPHEGAYNLYFEQPRLLFDNIGTREFVVYNPLDQHLMLSHTSWFLLFRPDELEENQGWYEVHDTPSPHWKYFWFD